MSSDRERQLIQSVQPNLYIDGVWRPARDGKTFDVQDPSTGLALASIADGGPADAAEAMDAAHSVQGTWARTAPRERSEVLRRAFELVTERADDFALLMTLEMGKPLNEARGEVVYGAEFLRWFSEEAVRPAGRYATAPDGNSRLLITRKPVGPCLLITPWNFPFAMATRKIAPAIAAGCTMVLKPANLTPLTAILLTQVMEEAGLPAGVLNTVNTTTPAETTLPLIKDPRLRKLSFTGSTAVGRQLLKDSADMVLRTSMELGGNAPFIVFDDADIEEAVTGAMAAKLRNMGEACTAANRFIVHKSVATDFSRALAERVSKLQVGRGTELTTQIGPLIDARSVSKVKRLVDEAVREGALILTGGRAQDRPGFFFEPTVLVGVKSDANILQEEIFGPVAPISTFNTEDEAVRMANDTEYGLAAYVYTRDISRGLRMAELLETGMLGLNTGVISNAAAPFGGVKQSGMGREGGSEGIAEYQSVQYVAITNPFAS